MPLLLRRAWYGLNQSFRRLTTQAGITPDQFTVLRTLREQDSLHFTQRELADEMSSDPNTIASLVRRMEAHGLIERRVHPEDRRAHCLALKPAGRRKFSEVRRLALALQKSILSVLPDEAREDFLSRLEIVAHACWQTAQHGRVTGGPTVPATKRKSD